MGRVKNHEVRCPENSASVVQRNGRCSPNGPWNKGKTKATDHRILRSAQKTSQSLQGRPSHPQTHETRQILSTIAKSRNFGGYQPGSGRGRRGRYQNIWCDSSWELAWVIFHLEHDIPFVRNTQQFEYQFNGRSQKYLPDFRLSSGVFVEIKGYQTSQWRAKLAAFSLPLQVIGKKEIVPYLDYTISKYGKDFVRLYLGDLPMTARPCR